MGSADLSVKVGSEAAVRDQYLDKVDSVVVVLSCAASAAGHFAQTALLCRRRMKEDSPTFLACFNGSLNNVSCS